MCGSVKDFNQATVRGSEGLELSCRVVQTQVLTEICSTFYAFSTILTAPAKERKVFLGIETTSKMSNYLCVISC